MNEMGSDVCMAKDKRPKFSPRRPVTVEQSRFRRQVKLNLTVFLVLILGGGVGYSFLRKYVDQRLTFPTDAPQVVLKNRPVWMSDFLAEQIVNLVRPSTGLSTFDQQPLIDTYDLLKHNPWVKDVHQVRRVYRKKPGDTIEIDCEYRAPIALVRYGDVYALVDAEGIKLPELFNASQLPQIMFGRNGQINIRVIEGVLRAPPDPGHKWISEDLSAGLEMVRLLYGKPFAEQLQLVRVNNYHGRVDSKEAWLVLLTRDQTEVRWGRPPSASDAFAEVPWHQKLANMERIMEKYHRIDAGHSAVDLRFDQVTFPSEDLVPDVRSATLRQEP
jgi:hypothetical protein